LKNELTIEDFFIEKNYRFDCPRCGQIRYYSSYQSCWNAKYRNSFCKCCGGKKRRIVVPDCGWVRNCPTCNKRLSYSCKGKLKRAIEENNNCRSCGSSKRPNNRLGKHLTEITKKKLSESHKGLNIWSRGRVVSESTKKNMSLAQKLKWKNGCFSPSYKSKEQKEILNYCYELGYKPKEEYFIEGKPFDILITELNTIIEFNGTYWHCDPRKYKSDYYHKQQKKTAEQQWKYDKEKNKLAENAGYKVKVIWEDDWKKCENKLKFVQEVLNAT